MMSPSPSDIPPAIRSESSAFHYAWIVAAVTFVAAGVRSMAGILVAPLEHDFGWSRAMISFAVSINLLLYGLRRIWWSATVGASPRSWWQRCFCWCFR